MKIGFIGLGKLGLPVALAIESKKHQIYGYDIDNNVIESIREKKIPYKEKGIQKLLNKTKINILPIKKILEKSELIFIAIQTPHEKKYEGITKIPNSRKDFNYTYIVNLIKKLSLEANKLKIKKNIVIISTVLPGTIRKKIIPIKSKYINICYNPFFIAMGNTINDFLKPEFILLGGNNKEANKKVIKFYKTINTSKVFSTTLENAELIKVSYNTFISTKISFINTIMEACHKLPNTNVDQVSSALKMASKRLISKAYLNGGMGDGGGCHPRDNIALSHLSEKLNLSFNWFDNIMMQREKQTEWLASLIIKNKKK
jgi:UDPglucose 6-dehydrogenase